MVEDEATEREVEEGRKEGKAEKRMEVGRKKVYTREKEEKEEWIDVCCLSWTTNKRILIP